MDQPRSFDGVEQLAAHVAEAGLALQFCQLSGGRLRGQLLVRRLGPLQLLRLQANRRLHVTGPKPVDQQMVALDLARGQEPVTAPLRAHGVTVGRDMLFGLTVRSDVHLSTPAVLDLGVIMLPSSRLKRFSSELGWVDIASNALSSNCLRISSERHRRLRRFLLALLSSSAVPSETLSRDLVPLLLEAMVQGSSSQASLCPPPTRFELVKQVQRWVGEHPQEPITLDALCRQVHAGRRSLLQGFQEHLGMGPMAYIKLHRLHGIRRELLTADPRAVSIGGLAQRWGFLNAGHFARDYRRLFGELPSQTLAGGS